MRHTCRTRVPDLCPVTPVGLVLPVEVVQASEFMVRAFGDFWLMHSGQVSDLCADRCVSVDFILESNLLDSCISSVDVRKKSGHQ